MRVEKTATFSIVDLTEGQMAKLEAILKVVDDEDLNELFFEIPSFVKDYEVRFQGRALQTNDLNIVERK